jgi:hypothetical protein
MRSPLKGLHFALQKSPAAIRAGALISDLIQLRLTDFLDR